MSGPRHFLDLADLSRDELVHLLGRARRLKEGREEAGRALEGTTLALIFRKSSTRTRVSFEVGIHQLGGRGIFLSDRDTQLGRGEPIPDTARVLSGYVDAIMIRTHAHDEAEELARWSAVPVINGLTDRCHPCQLLADLLTLEEEFGGEEPGAGLEGLKVAWVGDGNNVANSWLNACSLLGFQLSLAVPEGHDPDPEFLARARATGGVELVRDPREAVEGAHVVTTDVWASMGEEDEAEARREHFEPFRVTADLMTFARPRAIFLHCLPAHRGEEVTARVIDGPASRVYRQAENRLHAQKALLLELLT
ncbi:MAG: ornithine carbamoyltransferase [Gemmatimonadales bacterium]|nr:MAG: ornithine carbamoyltransferase [Gemmatimonadales bacterium]